MRLTGPCSRHTLAPARSIRISRAPRWHEIEAVLESRQPRLDVDPEHVVFWLFGDDLRDALGRAQSHGRRFQITFLSCLPTATPVRL